MWSSIAVGNNPQPKTPCRPNAGGRQRERNNHMLPKRTITMILWVSLVGIVTDSLGAEVAGKAPVVVHKGRGDAQARVSLKGDSMFVDVVSPSGIGDVRLELKSGKWPEKVVVRLQYAAGKPITVLEGHTAILETSGKKTDEPRKRLKTRRLKPSQIEIPIPATEMRVLYIQWVDYFRH